MQVIYHIETFCKLSSKYGLCGASVQRAFT